MENHATIKTRQQLINLPGEIKNMIYDLVLQESRLKLDHKAKDRLSLKEPVLPLDLSTTPETNALLGTCHSIRDEAMPILAKHTTLEVRNAFLPCDPLRILPSVFLNNISTLEIDLDAFVHLTRKRLPMLRHITLIQRVEGIASLFESLHVLHCPNCGGESEFLREGMAGYRDWKWMKKQLKYLSEEEGWVDVRLSLHWECHAPSGSCLEVLYDIKTDKVLAKNGHVFGTVIDASKWGEAIDRFRELQTAHTE